MKSEKTFQKFLLLVLILLLAMGISACRSEDLSASESVSQNEEVPPELLEQDSEYAIRSTAALNVYNDLLLKKVSTSPADYAGAYMDKEGYLVVCVTEDAAIARYEEFLSPEVLQPYVQQAWEMVILKDDSVTIQADDVIRYEIQTYPYFMLSGAQKLLNPVMKEYEIASTAIDQEKNILEVSTVNDELREEILAYLQEGGYPEEIVSFEHSDGYIELE